MGIRKLTKKLNLKIAAATSMIIFTLAVAFSGVFAWFNSINSLSNTADDFKVTQIQTAVKGITFHKYYGETVLEDGTTYFAFDPEESGSVDFSGNTPEQEGTGVQMGEYSLENPNHPLLMMFEVEGGVQRVDFETEYAFLGNDNNFTLKTTVANYTALENLDKTSLSNGDYIKVTNDNEHGNVTTIYKYESATKTYDMVWINLAQNNNPLSSAVEFHSIEFTGTIASNTTVHDVYVENQYGNFVLTEDVSAIAIDRRDLTNSNRSSFVEFEDEDTFEFHKRINAYEGNVKELSYVGIIVNYNKEALEYVFSKFLGHDYLSDGLTFQCDWITEV